MTAKIVWTGSKSLRRFLVPIDELEPFPGNPRRGDVDAIRASLRRFGQVKTIVADGRRIVAGHHLRLAAEAEGWTHVAVTMHEFADEDEARAYLLADNRTAELGSNDPDDLVEHLRYLADLDLLVGTGYTGDDVDTFMAELQELHMDEDARHKVAFEARATPPREEREVVLHFSPSQYQSAETWLGIIAKECGTSGVSETVYEALRIAALKLNNG